MKLSSLSLIFVAHAMMTLASCQSGAGSSIPKLSIGFDADEAIGRPRLGGACLLIVQLSNQSSSDFTLRNTSHAGKEVVKWPTGLLEWRQRNRPRNSRSYYYRLRITFAAENATSELTIPFPFSGTIPSESAVQCVVEVRLPSIAGNYEVTGEIVAPPRPTVGAFPIDSESGRPIDKIAPSETILLELLD